MYSKKTNVHIMRDDAITTAGLRAILSEQMQQLNVTVHAIRPNALDTTEIIVADYQNGIAATRRISLEPYGPRDLHSPDDVRHTETEAKHRIGW
jgi:hypothetical protein